jgi:putative MATE family efflux protein
VKERRRRRAGSPHDRTIAVLALPALGALVADPLLSLVDTAFVGRIGSDALAALGVASAIFGVAFFVFNFLEYGTTSEVARAVGRDDREAAGRAVATAVLIAGVAGTGVAVVLSITAESVMRLFGSGESVVALGAAYVAVRALAAPAVLVVRAGHGAFRGFQDTKTPLLVAVSANVLNLVLDPILIFGLGWGITGAAWATVIAQWVAAAWFVVLLVRRADALGITSPRPVPGEVRRFLAVGRDLAIRTAALLATFTLATAVAARVSDVAVAAHQVLAQLFIFLALVLDALAIAAQALVGRLLGAGRRIEAAEVADRLLVLGIAAGLILAAALAAIAAAVPGWFSADAGVRAAIGSAYWILVAIQPLAAVVFVWDGVFIGVGDFRYLAGAMLVAAAVGGAALLAVVPLGWGLPGVWGAVALFLLVRGVTLGWRRWGLGAPLRAGTG